MPRVSPDKDPASDRHPQDLLIGGKHTVSNGYYGLQGDLGGIHGFDDIGKLGSAGNGLYANAFACFACLDGVVNRLSHQVAEGWGRGLIIADRAGGALGRIAVG